MRTLMRPGRKGVLIKIERRGSARFVVRGTESPATEVYGDLGEALRSFEDLERGLARQRVRASRWRIARRAYDGLRAPGVALWTSLRRGQLTGGHAA